MNGSNPLLNWSLQRALLYTLIPLLLGVFSLELAVAYRTVVYAANSAYDRSLLGAIKAIDSNVSMQGGGISAELPYNLLDFFQLTSDGAVYYRISTEDRMMEVGYPDLPTSEKPLKSGTSQFYDATYYGRQVRIAAYTRELKYASVDVDGPRTRITIQVAETIASRSEFINRLLLEAFARDLLLLIVVVGLLVLAVSQLVKPLTRLHVDVSKRLPLDLTPIDSENVPIEVRPLVHAINRHMVRTREITEDRRRFIDDASHQLRTPLATLRTQIDYLRREADPSNVKQAIDAVSVQLDDATRATNQLLAMARADSGEFSQMPVELKALGEDIAKKLIVPAREKKIDLELISLASTLIVTGDARMLREAAANLLDNAIRLSPESGRVSIQVTRYGNFGLFSVIDNGPGIPVDQVQYLGQRFFRARNAPPGGTGLGLAIARTVAEHHGGHLTVTNRNHETGCIATLHLPLAKASVDRPGAVLVSE